MNNASPPPTCLKPNQPAATPAPGTGLSTVPVKGHANPCLTRGSMGQGVGTLIVSMMWVCPLSTSTALLWLMSSNLTPLAARTWSPTRMPFCSASPPGSTLGKPESRMGPSPCWSSVPAPHLHLAQHPQ
uniref:Uncharacterized protein n=1 Tax=Ficedula albicollis TaxID=59894 RepID=A0A803W535_FICAL